MILCFKCKVVAYYFSFLVLNLYKADSRVIHWPGAARVSRDSLLPIAGPSDPDQAQSADSAVPDAAISAACPHFVHGELRHSLTPILNGSGGGGARLDWLLQRAAGGGGGMKRAFWTGSMVTVSGSAIRVVAPLPDKKSGGGVCDPGATATVAETAAQSGCAVALNAGLFDPGSGRCLGNLVSDGAVLHDSAGVKNAHFGITTSGHAFFGYLTEDQLRQGYFSQLVGGAIWLVRNGTNYVEQSIAAECSATQTTGSLRRFATVVSARSAVGQRLSGELVLLQVTGKTDVAGINLFDLADLLIDMGVFNAVNLDGGGSSTLVVNGTLVGSPSDYCPETPHLACSRPVTSVLCVPAAGCGLCNPAGGDCVAGRCRCRASYAGPGCYERCRCLNAAGCHPDSGGCVCLPGFRGALCESPCERGFFGRDCSRICVCGGADQAGCHHVNGTCFADDSGGGGDGTGDYWSPNGAFNLLQLVKRRLASVNWAVAVLPAALAASCLLNACLTARLCRHRRAARSRCQHHQPGKRLLRPKDTHSTDDSEQEALVQ